MTGFKREYLHAFHQFGNRDLQTIGKSFQHLQADFLFAMFQIRDVAAINAERVRHVALR